MYDKNTTNNNIDAVKIYKQYKTTILTHNCFQIIFFSVRLYNVCYVIYYGRTLIIFK